MGESLESFAHKTAKNLLTTWLRETAEKAGYDESANFGSVSWRVNRGAPHWGVWEEYPVLHCGMGIDSVWDEDWNQHQHSNDEHKDAPPTFEYLKSIGKTPRVIFDIAVQHKGRITAGIEIVHKHHTGLHKLQFIQNQCCSLFIIPASWILGQVQKPAGIPPQFRYIQ